MATTRSREQKGVRRVLPVAPFLGLSVDLRFAPAPLNCREAARIVSLINLKVNALAKSKHDTLALMQRNILAFIQHNELAIIQHHKLVFTRQNKLVMIYRNGRPHALAQRETG